jgi:hypothetical protein
MQTLGSGRELTRECLPPVVRGAGRWNLPDRHRQASCRSALDRLMGGRRYAAAFGEALVNAGDQAIRSLRGIRAIFGILIQMLFFEVHPPDQKGQRQEEHPDISQGRIGH